MDIGEPREPKTADHLPTGVVTFLFTDIEGSTRLLAMLGDEPYAVLLTTHHRILRHAIHASGGTVVNTEGDAFFAAFEHPRDALEAAVAAQRALGREPWPDGLEPSVRMGIHTGEARIGGDDYVGLAVHQAARIAAAAHGGQIIVSEETKDAANNEDRASLKSLGRHRLKDLGRPIELHQLCHRDLVADFPPPRSLERVAHNLPVQASSFVGRADEVVAGIELLMATRLLTASGPGGIGKTRLAYQVAAEMVEHFPDGVWAVELTSVADGDMLPSATVTALGLRQLPGQAAHDTVVDHLRTRTALLVFDNCEHVIDAAARMVSDILRSCPDVRVLATTREPLRIPGERAWALPSLTVPLSGDLPPDALLEVDAVRLFCERAREADNGFELTAVNAADAADVCSRLEGMPLALELAAARVRSMSPAQLRRGLSDSLALLSKGARGAQPRQATLRGSIAWSYDLLSGEEQILFARMAVFAGGGIIGAIEHVHSPVRGVMDLIDALVDKSLVTRESDEQFGDRYRLLEPIRAFAMERLVAFAAERETRDRHADWCLAHATTLEGVDLAAALDGAQREHSNMLAALRHLREQGRGDGEARLALALQGFWRYRGHWQLRIVELERCLETPGLDPTLEEAVLSNLGAAAAQMGRFPVAESRWQAALALARASGNRRREIGLLSNLAKVAALSRGEYDDAQQQLEVALAIAVDVEDRPAAGDVHAALANVRHLQGSYDAARSHYEAALQIAMELGQPQRQSTVIGNLGNLAFSLGDHAEARSRYEAALALARELGDVPSEGTWLANLGAVATTAGDYPLAAERYHEALTLARRVHREDSEQLEMAASLLGLTGDVETSARVLAAAEALRVTQQANRGSERLVRYERAVNLAKQELSPGTFAGLWEAGSRLGWTGAVDIALAALALAATGRGSGE